MEPMLRAFSYEISLAIFACCTHILIILVDNRANFKPKSSLATCASLDIKFKFAMFRVISAECGWREVGDALLSTVLPTASG
jgi:hypothetical protein